MGHLTNIYCPTVGHLIENVLKKSNAPPMPDPPLWGLTLIGALVFVDCEWSLVSMDLASRACEGKGGTADNTSINEIRPLFALVKFTPPLHKHYLCPIK